ncbi:hypothetical protein BDZ97DRAFT_1295927 [Flammula alnicola]|nr:hypothetical protein BDZ97DRAFT_1295927 [Flammula alnicola]
MDAFEAEGADYLGAVLIAAFYGLHLALFSFFVGIYRHQKKNPLTGVLNITATIQFILCTATAAVLGAATYVSLVTSDFEPHNKVIGPERNLNSAYTVLYTVIDFVTQASLTYRCFIVWEKRYIVIILPSLLTLATLCTGFAQVALLQDRHPTSKVINEVLNITTANFALSMAVNGIVTTMIITRIWTLSKRINLVDATYNIVVAMFFESGLTIFLSQLCALVLYEKQSSGYNVITGVVAQVYGFTPTIILIRIVLGTSYDSETKINTSPAVAPYEAGWTSVEAKTKISSVGRSTDNFGQKGLEAGGGGSIF